MNCSVCINEIKNVEHLYNDCVIEYLEKIKIHYISFKNKINENDTIIDQLRKSNETLQKNVDKLQSELATAKSPKEKRRKTNSFEESPLLDRTNLFGKGAVLADQSTDDLNIALNTENQFDQSLLGSQDVTPDRTPSFRQNSITPKSATHKSFLPKVKQLSSNLENKSPLSSDWRSKPNKLKKANTSSALSTSGNWNMTFVQPNLADGKTKLSLKSETSRLKQSRFYKNYKKDDSILGSADETGLEDDIVLATPKQPSRANRSKMIRSLIMRKCNDSSLKGDDDGVSFNLSADKSSDNVFKTPEKKKPSPVKSPNKTCPAIDSSSLFILSPEKEIIFLDDEDQSEMNIESADLLKDMMNQNESGQFLHYLRQVENDRIKHLQKKFQNDAKKKTPQTAISTAPVVVKKEKPSPKKPSPPPVTSSGEFIPMPIQVKEEESSPQVLKPKTKSPSAQTDRERKFARFINCDECQSFLKYFGDNLTDDEIERRLRNCSKHRRGVDINPTPDGFWDPFIEPLSKDDPRNITLIDTRFVNTKKK